MITIPEPARAPDKVELDAGHWLEALHATHIAETLFEQHVYDHPAVAQTPELRAKAAAILTALGELYQAIEAGDGAD